MKTVGYLKKSEIDDIVKRLNNGESFSNKYFQFVKRKDGVMLKYDLTTGKYTFFKNNLKFARSVLRFTKRGF